MLFACLTNDDWYSEEDSVLWTRLRCGEQPALETLFKRHHQHLFNYGINITSERELVNDAIQQVFLFLWKKHHKLSEARSVRAYLLTAVRRSIFKQIKGRKNRNERGKTYLEKNSVHTFSIEHRLIQEELSQELTRKLDAALNELTPRQKEAIFLRFYNGLTNDEISVIMDINYQCVCNLLYDAISRLRSILDYKSLAG